MEDNNTRTAADYQKAEKIALRLIARAEQCSVGLARKLEKRGCSAAGINGVISNLCGLKLLDDSRFARMWLQSRLRFTRSPRRLLLSLCARGIDRGEAEAAMKEVLDRETEFLLLKKFVKKYAGKAAVKTSGSGESVTRYIKSLLRNEGFSPSAIQGFLEE